MRGVDIKKILEDSKAVRGKRARVFELQGSMKKSVREQLGVKKLEYNQYFPYLVRLWASYGHVPVQIARNLGITLDTAMDWRRAHPDFGDAWDEGIQTSTAVLLERILEGDLDLSIGRFVLNTSKLLVEHKQIELAVSGQTGKNNQIIIDFGDREKVIHEDEI
jgi:hypothetical protein